MHTGISRRPFRDRDDVSVAAAGRIAFESLMQPAWLAFGRGVALAYVRTYGRCDRCAACDAPGTVGAIRSDYRGGQVWRSRTAPLCTNRRGPVQHGVRADLDARPGAGRTGQRDLLEVLFWVTSAEGAGFGRTLTWRVYVVDRGGIAIACETPLLVTRGFLVLFSPSMAEELRARARLIVRRDGTYTCEPGPAR